MVVISKGFGPKKDCAGKSQHHIQKTDPSSRQRGRLKKQDRNCQTVINIWSWAPWGSTPRLTDWLTVSRSETYTLAKSSSVESEPVKRRLRTWCETAASLGPSSLTVDKSSARANVKNGPERGKLNNLNCVKSVARKRLVTTVIDWWH
jgi:hypothetical protein